ncbi:hypothetical protein Mmc1_2265 [Magnetococcus marinus MC-1]|uniref:Magnetosome protein MamC n=1 Tax=Magnetococcus marinus (strain ATCC BAA-1437 / JCM 17883 / MC-1) TaxID=156889 RepID=MAMC_MAGMM|nr:magnetosome protein MamC [Magnetococcus marinus]A0L9X3.1 RecName: Full=Magnetosome protein MamC [Magnetococcus marinus MC-1]ABK44766.1 hypothetical protein Mmc1_2265 [Magnetococcus marinus MC-1]
MAAFNLALYLSKSIPGVGVLGGVIGGSAALAKNLKAKQRGEITTEEAVIDTGKEALGAGLATTVSAYAAGVVGGGLVVSLGTAFAVAVAGKYAWDYGMEQMEAKLQEKKHQEQGGQTYGDNPDPFDPQELETP